MNHIPIHILQERTNKGLQIRYMDMLDVKEDDSALRTHRDDHYIFFILEEGLGAMMVDFDEVHLAGNTIYYLLPGQVHSVANQYSAKGWFVAVDPSLVPQDCRNVFESQLLLQQLYPLNTIEMEQCISLLRLFYDKYNEEVSNPFHSRWAGNLIVGDTVFYFRQESTRQSPHPTDCVVGLGDARSVGHLLALQQLTVPVSRFDMAVILDSPQSDLLRDTFSPVLNILSNMMNLLAG